MPPPRLVYESWKLSTAPVEVSVVAVANAAEFGHAEPGLGALRRRADRGRHRAVVRGLRARSSAVSETIAISAITATIA